MSRVHLGLRANAAQFSLLVGLNAVVGATVGLERSVLPLIGEEEFGLASKTAILSFVVAFGAAKALANLASGPLADRAGRKRVLVLGWALALPAPVLVGLAESWTWIVGANLFLGASQGLAWSMTVLMKIDLAGPKRRGFALGLNESAGYVGLSLTALLTGALAGAVAPRSLVWTGALLLAAVGLVVTLVFVRETAGHARFEQRGHGESRSPPGLLRACAQVGFVNNANDALAWGLLPVYLAANGASAAEIGLVAGIYPAVWGAGQLGTGALSDVVGRIPLVTAGMVTQGLAHAVFLVGGGSFAPALAAAALLGLGTALVYPTLIAAVSDAVEPRHRAGALGVYRFWRDAGLVGGALAVGIFSDVLGSDAAIAIVGGVTALSGLSFFLSTSQGKARSLKKEAPMATGVEIDVDLLKSEIKRTYASVSQEPEKDFIFPTGRAWAADLGYPAALLGGIPETAVESFAGVANPFSLGQLEPGERVLDLGCGAGTDSLVAAQMVGREGKVTGIDMTPEMLGRARTAAAEMNQENVEFVEAEAERLPFADGSFDVVISNGVIDLIPDKDAVFSELHRVLAPGGRIQVADVTIQNPVSEEGRRDIDLWTG